MHSPYARTHYFHSLKAIYSSSVAELDSFKPFFHFCLSMNDPLHCIYTKDEFFQCQTTNNQRNRQRREKRWEKFDSKWQVCSLLLQCQSQSSNIYTTIKEKITNKWCVCILLFSTAFSLFHFCLNQIVV